MLARSVSPRIVFASITRLIGADHARLENSTGHLSGIFGMSRREITRETGGAGRNRIGDRRMLVPDRRPSRTVVKHDPHGPLHVRPYRFGGAAKFDIAARFEYAPVKGNIRVDETIDRAGFDRGASFRDKPPADLRRFPPSGHWPRRDAPPAGRVRHEPDKERAPGTGRSERPSAPCVPVPRPSLHGGATVKRGLSAVC